MKKIGLSVLFIVTAFLSCTTDEDTIGTEEELLMGTWTVTKVRTYYYLNGELDTIKEVISKEPNNTIQFKVNKEVVYSNPDFTNVIAGKWTLDEDTLKTDLKIDLSSPSGFGTIYFFPENLIIELDQKELILRSPMSLEATNANGEKKTYYSETYLEK